MKRREISNIRMLVTALVTVLLLVAISDVIQNYIRFVSAATTLTTSFPHQIGVFKAPDGEMIGVSDGSYAFDLGSHRPDSDIKQQASSQLLAGANGSAISIWRQALDTDPADAESAIYLQDQRVLASGNPYLTIVVAVPFQPPYPDYGSQDTLQGAYIAQQEFNAQTTPQKPLKLRLLIAKSGTPALYANTIARQIVEIAHSDHTLLGVMGWTKTDSTLNAVAVLAAAHLPLISQTASGDELSGISPYFFRVVPPNNLQGSAGAKYAERVLHAQRAVIFTDVSDPYTQGITHDFAQQFTSDGYQILPNELYTTGTTTNFQNLITNALGYNPDILYFTSSIPTDIKNFMSALPTTGLGATIPVISSDAAHLILNYPDIQNQPTYTRLHFTTFTSFDVWTYLNDQPPVPFFTDYAQNFDPDQKHTNTYGYSRPDDVAMLSYDALLAIWTAALRAQTSSQKNLTPADLLRGLSSITSSEAVQGLSGAIAFDSKGDPSNKPLVILKITSDYSVQITAVQGCFLLDSCR